MTTDLSDESTFYLRVCDVEPREQGVLIKALRDAIGDVSAQVSVNLKSDDPSHQDFGATLVLVLGTPAIIAVAKGIEAFLKRHRVRITIECDDGKEGKRKLVAVGLESGDAARIAEAFATRK